MWKWFNSGALLIFPGEVTTRFVTRIVPELKWNVKGRFIKPVLINIVIPKTGSSIESQQQNDQQMQK